MQVGLRQGLIDAALVGPKGTTTLQHQCDPLEWRAFSRDMGLAQQRPAARHHGPPVLTARVAPPHASLRPILGNMTGDIEFDGGPMSALGPKQTYAPQKGMSALTPKATSNATYAMSAKGQ